MFLQILETLNCFTWDLDSSEVLAEIFPEGFMILVWEQLHLALYERSSSQNW
jgi:hypothetical protein